MPQLSKRKTKQVLDRLKAETQQSKPTMTTTGGKKPGKKTADSKDAAKQLRLDDYVVSFTTSAGDNDDFIAGGTVSGGFEKVSKLIGKQNNKKKSEQKEAEEQPKPVMQLDETQAAITKMDINRPLLIVAGAGSGKTTTLCARVLEMMQQGVAAPSILVITFTNKAADELKERIKKYAGHLGMDNGKLPFAATFHSWCYGLVMRNYRALGWQKCPMVVAAEGEHAAIALIAIRQLESSRKLKQCEQMLGITKQEEAKADEGEIYVGDADVRWQKVAKVTAEKTGFTVEQAADGEGAQKSKSRKFGMQANEQAQQRAATDTIYSHLYAVLGRAQGLQDLDTHRLALGQMFPGKDLVKSIMSFIYSAKSRGDAPSMYPSLAGSVLAAYNGTLRKFHLVDFDDLLMCATQVLENQNILEQVRQEYPYLLVDEFQDLNQLQMRLVLQLQEGVGRVTAVGDERQSIFAFRGASCEHNFATFLKSFVDAKVSRVGQGQDQGDQAAAAGTMASLTRNYRSHQSIVDLGNIVARETGRGSALLERLRVPLTAQPSAPVVPVAVWSSRDKASEASRIVQRITRLLRSGDCQASDIAVISRVLNFGSYRPTALIEQGLLREGIPFVVRGGSSALKSPRMQAMMALIRVVANQSDDVAADKCLDNVVKDIGPAAKLKIQRVGAGRMPEPSLFERMRMAGQTTLLPKHSRGSLLAFVASVDRWAGVAKSGEATLRDLVRMVYDEYVKEVDEPEDPRAPVGQKIRPPDAIWEMISAIADSLGTAAPGALFEGDDDGHDDDGMGSGWSANADGPCSLRTLHLFSSQMCLLSSSAEDKGRVTRANDNKKKKKTKKGEKDDDEDGDEENNAVVITTVHQAKGLEWEHVFVPHFIDNLFPMGFRGVSEADRVRGSVSAHVRNDHELQHYREEGRLAYVAITRARRGLYISTLEGYPEFWMKKIFDSECSPSRYLPVIMCPASNNNKSAAEYLESDFTNRASSKRGRWY